MHREDLKDWQHLAFTGTVPGDYAAPNDLPGHPLPPVVSQAVSQGLQFSPWMNKEDEDLWNIEHMN